MVTSKYTSRLALSESQIYAIGFVAAEWSSLEFGLMAAIGELLGLEIDVGAALAGLFTNINAMTDAIVRLANELDQWADLAPQLEAHCNGINDLAAERNNIVHGTWDVTIGRDDRGAYIIHAPTASGRGFPKRGRKPTKRFEFTALEMREVAIASHEATEALLHLIRRQPPPLPDTRTLRRVLKRQAQRIGSAPSSRPKPSHP
jgi:hypothetical protein